MPFRLEDLNPAAFGSGALRPNGRGEAPEAEPPPAPAWI
jgi:hypothetical protein